MKPSRKRFEASELLPAMLLSALIIAGAQSSDLRASNTPGEPSMQITVTTVR